MSGRVRSRRPRFSPAPLLGVATVLGLLAALEALIRTGLVSPFVVPPPSTVLLAGIDLLWHGNGLEALLATAFELLSAAVLVGLIGLSVGTLLYRVTALRRTYEGWVAALAATPLVLVYPFFLVMFGRSAATIVAVGVVAGLPPMVLRTIEGFAGVRPVLVDVGRALNLRPVRVFWSIEFPAALPVIFSGFRLGLGFALINIVGMEFLINYGGLGQLINEHAELYDLPETYACIALVVVVSAVFVAASEHLERRLRG
ncbi:hypothetical protein CH341_10635 [Rhodoplanes roseus]|uniref:ABC transmembrane type-1 domain-containing protein n=1 Tax=Rhodoplanes roseus TaxID=29409 RepID=A0A327L2E0_9BRAD|nr:hypothetical protein CH341_10635 [Rhodoplanes roseus]